MIPQRCEEVVQILERISVKNKNNYTFQKLLKCGTIVYRKAGE
jgi:hypothetical protein